MFLLDLFVCVEAHSVSYRLGHLTSIQHFYTEYCSSRRLLERTIAHRPISGRARNSRNPFRRRANKQLFQHNACWYFVHALLHVCAVHSRPVKYPFTLQLQLRDRFRAYRAAAVVVGRRVCAV